MVASRIAFSQRGTAALPAALPRAKSSLVRRLVAARNDPAKQRIRGLLAKLEDERLSGLGLTPQDLLILRGSQDSQALLKEARRQSGVALTVTRR